MNVDVIWWCSIVFVYRQVCPAVSVWYISDYSLSCFLLPFTSLHTTTFRCRPTQRQLLACRMFVSGLQCCWRIATVCVCVWCVLVDYTYALGIRSQWPLCDCGSYMQWSCCCEKLSIDSVHWLSLQQRQQCYYSVNLVPSACALLLA